MIIGIANKYERNVLNKVMICSMCNSIKITMHNRTRKAINNNIKSVEDNEKKKSCKFLVKFNRLNLSSSIIVATIRITIENKVKIKINTVGYKVNLFNKSSR